MGMTRLLQMSPPIPCCFSTTLGVWPITLSCHIKKPRGPVICPGYKNHLHLPQCPQERTRGSSRCGQAVRHWQVSETVHSQLTEGKGALDNFSGVQTSFHPGQFQAPNMKSLNTELGRDVR